MYSQIYRNILFPFYETTIRRRKTLVYLKEMEKSQWLSYDELRQIQWEKLQGILRHTYENVPYYRNLFDHAGILPKHIKTFDDLTKIPFLTKKAIRENQGKLVAVNYKTNQIFKSATGGSTGAPVQVRLDHNNYECRQAAAKRVYGWAGYNDGERTIFIWGGSVGKVSKLKKIKHNIDERLKNHKIYNTFYFDNKMIARCAKEINVYKPEHFVAYTSPLYNLANFIKENGIKIWSPKSIIVGAEKLFSYQRKTIEDVFGCPVFETYGCREVTSIAGECEIHKGMHINMENIYVEIVRGEALAQRGEPGEVVVTDLTNYCMHLIRYKNEDIGSLAKSQCKCGRGLEMLEKVDGRLLDTIQTSDGKFIPGEFFPHLMKEFPAIDKFQILQEDLGSLCIKIVKKKNFNEINLNLMKKEIFKVMGDKIHIDFNFVDEIPLTATGKFRVVSSKVPLDMSRKNETAN